MIKIVVTNRENAKTYDFKKNFSIISVYSPDDEPNEFQTKPNKVLSLCFSDTSEKRFDGMEGPFGKMIVFKEEMADKILKFVDEQIEKGVDTFLIHCDAGMSRSPGIAVALDEIYNENNKPFTPLYNKFVYKTIINFRRKK